jgi:phospholipid/cholesterol/gamma-HCH transport system substrate-binding protein
MSITKNKRAVIVGIFVLVGVGLLIAIILIMGGQRKSFARTINVTAIFNDVSGLQQGNNIWLAGVKVGTVRTISFNSDSKVMVSMNILASMRPYIHKDAKAKISSESLIGNKIVVLTQGSPQSPFIQSGDILEIQPALNTEDMMNTLQQNNTNLLAITTDLKDLTGGLAKGQGSLGKLLKDETLVNTLQRTVSTLNTAAGNANALTDNLSRYTAKLQAKGSLANELVTDTIVFNRLRSSVINLKQIAQSAEAVVDNLNKASSDLKTSLNSTSSPLGVLLNDPKAAADLKTTLTHLNVATGKLDEDLEAMQHNFLLKGYFRKKAKAQADTTHKY